MTKKIVILTGAGLSAESGLGTFRDDGGLWSQHRIEDVATPEGFSRNPALVHAFYNERREQASAAQPNASHRALAQLQRDWQDEVIIVTQNVVVSQFEI
jgi:NAD-dependent deacetylase